MNKLYTLLAVFVFLCPGLRANDCSTAEVVFVESSPFITWVTLFDNQIDGQAQWYVFTAPVDGYFLVCESATVQLYDQCSGGNAAGLIPTSPSFIAPTCDGLNTPVEESILLLPGNTIYIAVQGDNSGVQAQVAFVPNNGDGLCECYEYTDQLAPPVLPGGTPVRCESFEYYNNGSVTTQSTYWNLFSPSSVDAVVANYPNSSARLLQLNRQGSAEPNVVYNLSGRTSGRYRLSWRMSVETNRGGYFNVLHRAQTSPSSNIAYEVWFQPTGVGRLRIGNALSVDVATFNFPVEALFHVMQIIDLDEDEVELWIDDQFVYSWPFSLGAQTLNQLGGINFRARQSTSLGVNSAYLIDGLCLWQLEDCFPNPNPNGSVCLDNGMEFPSSSDATCQGYAPFEWEEGICEVDEVQGILISCGDRIAGSNIGSVNNFSGTEYNACLGFSSDYSTGEVFYKFTADGENTVVAYLQNLGLDLDLFLFDDLNGQPGQCLAASDNFFAGDGDEIIFNTQIAETYWLIIDGDLDPTVQPGEGPFELSLACYEVENLDAIDCGQSTIGSTIGQPNDFSDYTACEPGSAVDEYSAGEKVYRLDVVGEKDVVIRLMNLTVLFNNQLSLFLLDNGPNDQPGNCLFAGEYNFSSGAEEILAHLTDGTYWILIDGPVFLNNVEGPFQLSVDCYQDENVSSISCGQTIIGSTISNGNVRSDYSSCFMSGLGGRNYNAGDRRYSFQLAQEQTVVIQLRNLSARNIDLFLLENGPGGQPGACIEKSILPGEESEEIIAKLNAGAYWVMVDGIIVNDAFGGLIDPGEGPFELTLKCFGLPSICDLGGLYISNGNKVFFEPTTTRELPLDNFLFVDCIPSNLVYDSIPGEVYIYYHEGETDFFSLNLNTSDPAVRAFAFNCDVAFADRSDACEGGTDVNGFLNVPVPGSAPGFYYIVVFNQNLANYDLTILPDGPCSMETQYNCYSPIPTTFPGPDSHFNTADNYAGCYSGPIAYDGRDIVIGLSVGGGYLNVPPGERPQITLDGEITADGLLGLFLFDYQCAENCVGYEEYTDIGQPQGFSFLVEPGVYYLVLDEASPGAVSSFSISCSLGNSFEECVFDGASHEISFSPFAGASLVDSLQNGVSVRTLSIDYDRNDNAFRNIFYFDTFEMIRDPDGTLPNVFISEGGINGYKKCGYETDEKILYRAKLSNDYIAVFDAEYQDTMPPIITAAGRFNTTGSGKSRVRRFVLDTLSAVPKLFIDYKKALLRSSVGLQRGGPAPVPLATRLVNANNRWVVDKGPNSSWYTVSPDIDTVAPFLTQITIEALEENLSPNPRIDTFYILSPALEPLEVEVIQPPSVCFLNNPISLQIDAVSDSPCNGPPEGAVDITASGGEGGLIYNWSMDVGAVEDPTDLAPGTYILTVEDARACTVKDTITIACVETQGQDTIACGQSFFGSTIDAASDINGYPSCLGSNTGYGAGDRLYRFSLAKPQAVVINLKNLSLKNLDLFLLENGTGGQPGSCIDTSALAGAENEEILYTLDAGVYWIAVDGKADGANKEEGVFELSLSCFDLPTICDLDNISINGGNTVFKGAGLHENIPSDNIQFISCIESLYPVLPDTGDVFLYYHENPDSLLKLRLTTSDSDVRAFVFNCNDLNLSRANACLGFTDANGVLDLPVAEAGFYYILTACEASTDYSLKILADGPCSLDTQIACPDTPTSFTVSGEGDHYNTADHYAGCYPGSRDYDGEDKVLVLDVFSNVHSPYDFLTDEIGDEPNAVTIYFSSTGGSMGLFVFDYQCGENCIAYIETPDDGSQVSLTLDIYNEDGTFLNTGV
ncbi:MAG: hypothetical protein KDD09_15395, partial [Phaeodactylibacter sp.]|nr:hypothetical protein [Phaeodactylibacter sp.]